MSEPTLAQCLSLAAALHAQGRLDEAAAVLAQALALDPDCASAHYNLGNVLQDMGRLDAAGAAYSKALAVAPDHAAAWNNLGNVYKKLDRLADAQSAYLRAIALKSDFAMAYDNLGVVLHLAGRLEDAVACYTRAIALKPDYSFTYDHLASALKDQGRPDQAAAWWAKALELDPANAAAHSNLLLSLHYLPGYTPAAIFAEHQRWAQRHAAPLAAAVAPHPNPRDPQRRLRIGYVSGDFKGHVVAFFLEPILRRHDHRLFHITCYSDVVCPDDVTARMRGYSDRWHDTAAWPDARFADQIRADGIDILVDLAGHTAGGRLLVFARKPAPVQISYLGYPDTTGLHAIDYRLTDPWLDPPGPADQFSTERLLRLGRCCLCYDRGLVPEVAPLPALTNRYVTFGSFNALAKVTPETLRLWADVLMVVPGSKLLLKATALGEAATQNRVRGLFAGYGISADRLELRGYLPSPVDHLELYHRVDIALDTFPYNGTTTTCEALSMGVPVITLAGRTQVSRTGVTLLSAVGLSQLIAAAPQDYLRIARELAGDLPRLAQLRHALRQRMQRSPLQNADEFVGTLEDTYRRLWQAWCAGA